MKYRVIMRVDGRLIEKVVNAPDETTAKRIALRESLWFGGKAEIISVVRA